MKKCTQCGVEKDFIEFYKDNRHPDGFRYNCKNCQNSKTKDWRKRNPTNVQKSLKKYYEAHKENWQIREKNLSDCQREKRRIRSKEYFEKNKERILQEKREKYASIPKESKQHYSQEYYDANKEEICKRSRENYKNLSDEQKKNNTERIKLWRRKNRQKMRAWSAVGNALLRGDMVKPIKCDVCLNESNRLHAHHDDYEMPLEVVWVCHKCHMNIHKNSNRKQSIGN